MEQVESVDELTDEEVVAITDAMKANAVIVPTVEINDVNWKESVNTPIGTVKMGENQKAKLFAKGREQQYGMLLETLSNPDIVLEEKDKEQNMFHERPSSYLFVKTFQKEDGSKYVHFESVTVLQDGMEVSISSHIIRKNQLKNKLKSDRLLYKATALDAPANTSAEQPIVSGSLSSDGKGNNISDSVQENGDKSSKTKQSKSTAEEKPFNAIIEMLRKKFPDASMEALTAADRLLREQALPGERQKAIEAVAKALGLKVEWRDTMEKENSTFNPKTRTITIARDSEHALANTFGHEVTHAVRNLSEADYKNLKDAVRRLYSSEKEYNEAVQAYGDEYTGLDFDALEEELIADNIGFMIGGRNDMTQELASRMNHRVLWAIHDAMNKVRNALAKVLHIDSKKNGLLEALDSARATIRETMANAQRIAKGKGQGLSNESGSARQSLRMQDSAIRDAFVERMRLSGMDVITDETGQRVLDLANGKVRLMGSRTNKKMKEIADVLSEHELSEQQKTVVDVYSGKTDNLQLEVSRNDGNRRIVIRQGNDNKAGTKHSVYRHYGTTEGVITAEDILLIPEVLNRGERKSIKRGNTQLYEYVLRNVNGAEYTVLTEINNFVW